MGKRDGLKAKYVDGEWVVRNRGLEFTVPSRLVRKNRFQYWIVLAELFVSAALLGSAYLIGKTGIETMARKCAESSQEEESQEEGNQEEDEHAE